MKEKRILVFLFLSIFLISFVSAYVFSLEQFADDILSFVDVSTIILGAVFLLSFLFLYYLVRKFLKNDAWAGVVAFSVAFVIIYFLNKSNLNLDIFLINLGIPRNFLYNFVSFAFFIGFILFIWFFNFYYLFLILGLIFLTSGIAFGFNSGALLWVGIIFLLIAFFIKYRKKKNNQDMGWINSYENKIVDRSGHNRGWIHNAKNKVVNVNVIAKRKVWQRRLNMLVADNQRLARRNNGRIPKRGTPDGERRARNIKKMKVLENLIRTYG